MQMTYSTYSKDSDNRTPVRYLVKPVDAVETLKPPPVLAISLKESLPICPCQADILKERVREKDRTQAARRIPAPFCI
jgi:hypothetical protein